MKSRKLWDTLKERRWAKVNGLVQARNDDNWPVCAQCGGIPLGACAIKDSGPDPECPKWLEIWGRCDGKEHTGSREDYARVELPVSIPIGQIAKMVLSTGKFFTGHSEHETDDATRLKA